MDEDTNWKTKTIIVGGLIGAVTGLGAAYLLVQRAERQGEVPRLGASEGMRLGIGVLNLLRQVSKMGGRGG